MKTNQSEQTYKIIVFNMEHLVFMLIFIIALALRLLNLGDIPLNEYEANWGLQAFQMSQGEPVAIGSNPAYVVFTSWLFSFLGSSAAFARLIPALLGSILVWLPFALRQKLGQVPAIIFAIGLSLDPGLVAVSRVAGSGMITLGFAALLVIAWTKKTTSVYGILAGLILLSGPSLWFGGLGVVLGWLLHKMLLRKSVTISFGRLKPYFVPAVITIFLVATNFSRYPQGLSAFAASIPDFIGGWTTFGEVPASQIILALLAYQPLAIIFGLIGMGRAFRNEDGLPNFLTAWTVVGLLLVIIYPSRQTADLIWMLVPLWGLAANELGRYFRYLPNWNGRVVLIGLFLTFIFLVFFWMDLSGLTSQAPVSIPDFIQLARTLPDLDFATRAYVLRVIIALLVPILIGLSILMIGAGWSAENAYRGFVWGLALFLSLIMVGVTWRASHLRTNTANEIWRPGPAAGYLDVMGETVDDFSEWNEGQRAALEIAYTIESDILEWQLRDQSNAHYIEKISEDNLPAVVITSLADTNNPVLNSTYRGQSFPIVFHRSWENGLPPKFLSWFMFRDTTTFSETIVLWARVDIFPGGSELNLKFP
ncbi:MAG: hypothetical protein N2D54_03590 [Chloroflexota bacterium]